MRKIKKTEMRNGNKSLQTALGIICSVDTLVRIAHQVVGAALEVCNKSERFYESKQI